MEYFVFIDIRFDSDYDFFQPNPTQAAAIITTPYKACVGGGSVCAAQEKLATHRDDDKYERFSNLGRSFPHGVEMYLDMGDIVE